MLVSQGLYEKEADAMLNTGRFREFILTQVLAHTIDPEIKTGIERLLKEQN